MIFLCLPIKTRLDFREGTRGREIEDVDGETKIDEIKE